MMTFTPTQKELFNKNIEALSNILLKESLKEIKSSKFELILGKDNLDINLKDTSDNTFKSVLEVIKLSSCKKISLDIFPPS